MKARVLHMPDYLAARIVKAAARAFPEECCGLIEGYDTKDGWQAIAIHPTPNLADDKRQRFLIDPQVQFELLKRLRGKRRRIVGCFHSHPDGRPEPSTTDLAGAFEPGFLYIIAGGSRELGFELGSFMFDAASDFAPVEVVG